MYDKDGKIKETIMIDGVQYSITPEAEIRKLKCEISSLKKDIAEKERESLRQKVALSVYEKIAQKDALSSYDSDQIFFDLTLRYYRPQYGDPSATTRKKDEKTFRSIAEALQYAESEMDKEFDYFTNCTLEVTAYCKEIYKGNAIKNEIKDLHFEFSFDVDDLRINDVWDIANAWSLAQEQLIEEETA